MTRLRIVASPEGGEVGRVVELTATESIIGRSHDVAVVLNDSAVSRRHARLVLAADVLSLEDLGSINGTLVNGARVPSAVLKKGDRLVVGETTLEVEEAPPAASVAPPGSGTTADRRICPHCQAQTRATAKFCPLCGKPLTTARLECPDCHTELAPMARFCPSCGTPVR
jgi:pSer/pThr/pTyr-binding forkhead associated (FHA) protein